MKITDFKSNNLNIINSDANIDNIQYSDIEDVLQGTNISFNIIDIPKIHAMILCEAKASYLHQSQRYTNRIDYDKEIIENIFGNKATEIISVFDSALDLYKRMTITKNNVTKRPKRDDFVYGITYDDARFILPVLSLGNIIITCNGSELIQLYKKLIEYDSIFSDLCNQLTDRVGKIGSKISGMLIYNKITSTNNTINPIIYNNNPVFIIDSFNGLEQMTLAGLMSSNSNPDDIFDGMTNDKKSSFINRVAIGFGHSAIEEHSRFSFGSTMSMATYNQFIRHRHVTTRRDSFIDSFIRSKEKYYVPESIKNSDFYCEYKRITEIVTTMINMYSSKLSKDKLSLLMLNNFMITHNSTMNMREEFYIYKDRLCNTAYEEIRCITNELFGLRLESNPYLKDLYYNSLPPCVRGLPCKEGSLTCGKYNNVREYYNNIYFSNKDNV
jgi:thymidylate synthase (FAD)